MTGEEGCERQTVLQQINVGKVVIDEISEKSTAQNVLPWQLTTWTKMRFVENQMKW
jgi:hypothetical protein